MHQVFLYANCNRSLAYTAVSHENWSNSKMCCLRQTSVKSQRSVFDRWKHLMYSQRYSSSTLKVVQMESQSVRLSRRSDHDSWLIFNMDDFINAKIFFYYYYYYFFWPRYSIPEERKNYAMQYKKSTKIKLEWTLLLLLLLHKTVMQ